MIAVRGRPALGEAARRTIHRGRGALGQTMATALLLQGGLFLSGPLVARMLGVEDRGHFAELTLWPTVIGTIVIWGLPTAVAYERASSGPLPGTLLRGVAGVAAAQAVLAAAIHALAMTLWTDGAWKGAMLPASLVALLLGPAFIARDYTLAVLQGARNFRWFNYARLSHILVYLPLIVALWVAGRGSLWPLTAVSVAASTAISCVAVGVIRRSEPSAPTEGGTTTLRGLLRFGQQAHLGRLMPIERFRADQLVIALFLAPSALGLYAVAVALTNVMRFLTQAIGYVAFPTVASEREPRRARALTWRFVRMAAALSAAVVVALEVVGPWLVEVLFGAEFAGAGTALRLLLPGVGVVGVRRVLAESLRGGGLTMATTTAELVTVGAFVVLVYPFLGVWGINGVAATVSIAETMGLGALLLAMRQADRGAPRAAARAAT